MNANFTSRMLVGCSILVVVCQSAAMAGGHGNGNGQMRSNGAGFHGPAMNAMHTAPVQKMQTLKANNTFQPNTSATALKVNKTKIVPTTGTTSTGAVVKSPIQVTKIPTGGVITSPTSTKPKLPGGAILQVPGGVMQTPTGSGANPTGGKPKLPSGAIQQIPGGVFQNPTGGSTPPAGGSTPPAGGSTGTTPPAGGGTGTTPPTGGGSMPPSNNCHHNNCGPNWFLYNPGLYANWGLGYGSGLGYGGYGATPVCVNSVTSAPVALDISPVASVQTAAVESNKLTMKLGQSYNMANDNFGENTGDLALVVNGLSLPVHVDQWNAQQVSFTLPTVGLAQASDGTFQIIKADHNLGKAVPVMVVAAQ